MAETCDQVSLARIFEGWDGYNTSIIKAIEPRTAGELAWRPVPSMRSAGETAAHIALGRLDWFHRMGVPEAGDLLMQLTGLYGPRYEDWEQHLAGDPGELVRWLKASWGMIDATLRRWTVTDVWKTFKQPYGGHTYAVSRQWVLWRMMSHDIQHGGQLTVMLADEGIALHELGFLGGHLTEPPIIDEPAAA